jgi:hypothetical protein
MKLAIVGSRCFNDYPLMEKTISELFKEEEIEQIISGGAKGADTLAEQWAKNHKKELRIIIPSWASLGRAAGFERNVQIVKDSDIVLVFWDSISKGSKHDIDLCKRYAKECHVIKFDPRKNTKLDAVATAQSKTEQQG